MDNDKFIELTYKIVKETQEEMVKVKEDIAAMKIDVATHIKRTNILEKSVMEHQRFIDKLKGLGMVTIIISLLGGLVKLFGG